MTLTFINLQYTDVMNIIFDLGGVVLNWNPENLINSITDNEVEKDLLIKHLFNHPEWIELDRGSIERESVIENSALRSGLSEDLIKKVFDSVPQELTPRKNMVNLLYRLSQKGIKLYVLSNMHRGFTDFLLKDYDFWHLFHGIVFSCDIKMIKPDENIYNYIVDKYALLNDKTIFIDDTEKNLVTAKRRGIEPLLFKEYDKLIEDLNKEGVTL